MLLVTFGTTLVLILVNPVLSAIFIVARSSFLEEPYINGTLSIDLTPGN